MILKKELKGDQTTRQQPIDWGIESLRLFGLLETNLVFGLVNFNFEIVDGRTTPDKSSYASDTRIDGIVNENQSTCTTWQVFYIRLVFARRENKILASYRVCEGWKKMGISARIL